MSNEPEHVMITNITKRKRFRLRGGYLYIEKGTYKFFVNNFFKLQHSILDGLDDAYHSKAGKIPSFGSKNTDIKFMVKKIKEQNRKRNQNDL